MSKTLVTYKCPKCGHMQFGVGGKCSNKRRFQKNSKAFTCGYTLKKLHEIDDVKTSKRVVKV